MIGSLDCEDYYYFLFVVGIFVVILGSGFVCPRTLFSDLRREVILIMLDFGYSHHILLYNVCSGNACSESL